MSFRDATGQRTNWVSTGVDHGFSNFLFIDQHYRSNPILRRIFSLARKQNYRSLLIEIISEGDCALLAEETAAIQLRNPKFIGSTVHRLAFFKCLPDQSPLPADFLGYVILKSDSFSDELKPRDYVFEAVVLPSRGAEQNNFIHCSRAYQVRTTAGTFTIIGVLYAQQNNLTSVCAHVSLRTALACVLPEADVTYARINALAGIDHTTKLVGNGQGLLPQQIEIILSSLGVNYGKIAHEPSQGLNLPSEFQRDLYGFIEAGCPALVGFALDDPSTGAGGGGRHIIPVIGHTFNEDTWVPDAQRLYFNSQLSYFPSESWLSSYVIHDDNFGPYYCLPRHFLKKDNFRLIYGLKPHATPFDAVEAEAVGLAFFQAIANFMPSVGKDWYDRFVVFQRCGLLVLRTTLITKSDYMGHLRSMRSAVDVSMEENIIHTVENHLPESFWMIEASAPELFASSRRKFGELLISAQIPIPKPLHISLLIAARLPGVVMIQKNNTIETQRSRMEGHTNLFNLQRNGVPTGTV